jgi:hypothetical protein
MLQFRRRQIKQTEKMAWFHYDSFTEKDPDCGNPLGGRCTGLGIGMP